MTMKNTSDRYGALSAGMHRLMLVLLVAGYTCNELREPHPKGGDPRVALKTSHFTLGPSVFATVMPLPGWLPPSAKGSFFGLELPALIGADKVRAGQPGDTHKTIGTGGYYLIGLHAATALFHHYVMHDDALLRMLPRCTWKTRRCTSVIALPLKRNPE